MIRGFPGGIAVAGLLLCAGCPNLQGVPALGSPSPLDFGDVPASDAGQTRPIVIENIGGASLGVTSATMIPNLDGIASSSTFSVGQPIPSVLSSGQQAIVEVTFNPVAGTGFSRGRVRITTDSSRTPEIDVSVTGKVEPQTNLPSLPLDFGAVPIQTRKVLSIQITATRGVAAPVMPKPPISSPFQLGSSFPSDGGLFEQQYVFAPTSTQSYEGNGGIELGFSPCTGCAQQKLILMGQGIHALEFEDLGGGALSSFDLGSVVVGVDAGYRVKLVNQWNDQVAFDGLNDVAPFTAAAGRALMNPKDRVDVALGFNPTEAGRAMADLVANYRIGSEALASAPLALTALGISDRCSLRWSPPSIFFGYVPVGMTEKQVVRLTNEGALPCTVTNFVIYPAGEAAQFPLLGTPLPDIPAFGGVGLLEVDFKPKTTVSPNHQRGATLTFDTGDPVNPDGGISLSGSLQLETYGASAWPKWHHDNGNTGLSPVDTSLIGGNNLLWSAPVGAGFGVTYLQGPALDESGSLYVLASDSDGPLCRLNPSDGGNAGTWPVPHLAQSSAPGGLQVAGVESTPSILGGQPWLAIATDQLGPPRVLTVGGATVANFGSSGPAAGFLGVDGGLDGGLYVADDLTSRVLRVSESGAVLQSWDLCGGGPVCALETFSGAVADDGTSYWTGGSSYAFGLAADGTSLWSVSLSSPFTGLTVHAAPALLIASGVVYGVGAYQRDGGIYGATINALNQADGSSLWRVSLPEYDSSVYDYPIGYSSPALRSDGTVVVGYRDGVYLISPKGQLISWVHDANSSGVVGSAAIGADGTIYIGTLGGVLLAIDDKTCGADGGFCEKWHFAPTPGGAIGSSPAIGADGTIYFRADGVVGRVYALQ